MLGGSDEDTHTLLSLSLPRPPLSQMVMMAPAMAPAATMCVNPGAPVDVPVGMPGEALDAGLCAQLGLPIGTTWGANAASVRNLQVRS